LPDDPFQNRAQRPIKEPDRRVCDRQCNAEGDQQQDEKHIASQRSRVSI
jgi:hypothetical protein